MGGQLGKGINPGILLPPPPPSIPADLLRIIAPAPPIPFPLVALPLVLTADKVDKSSLQPGDHIFRFRLGGLYSHHGIYVGDGQVIHFNTPRSTELLGLEMANCIQFDMVDSEPVRSCKTCSSSFSGGSGSNLTIVKCCIDCFGDKIYLYKYGVSWVEFWLRVRGICCPFKSNPLIDAVNTAYDKLKNGFGAYDLITNNCEHFATFCRTGKRFSGQIFIKSPNLAHLATYELENIAAGNCTNMMMLNAAN